MRPSSKGHCALVQLPRLALLLIVLSAAPVALGVTWTNPAGGNWSDPANWGGTVPGLTDDAVINLAGTYTVTMDVSPSVNSLTLGAASGTQTLSMNAQTLTLTANSSVGANGKLVMINGTIVLNGGGRTFTNSGTIQNFGTSSITGSPNFFSNLTGALIHVEGNTAQGAAALTINRGFTSAGKIELTNSAANQAASLIITNGTLTNTGIIDLLVGAGGGGRTLGLALANQSTMNVATTAILEDPPGGGAAADSNSGTINLTANLDMNLAADTFTHTGTIAIGAGTTLTINSGTFNDNAGSLGGAGTLALVSTKFNLGVGFSNAITPLTVSGSTIGGTGLLTNATGLTVVASTINSPFSNQALLTMHGTCVIGSTAGNFTQAPAGTVRLEGDATSGTAALTVTNAFTNAGKIELTNAAAGQAATLNVTNGAVTNAGTIDILAGAGGGGRTLGLVLANQGTVNVNTAATLDKTGVAAHTNSGTMNLTSDLALTLTSDTFTQTGTISIGPGATLTVNAGTFNDNAGTLGGAGTLALSATTFNLGVSFSNAVTGLTVSGSTISGTGVLTNATGLTVATSTINTPLSNQALLTMHGACTIGSAAGSFTQAPTGTIRVEGTTANGAAGLTVTNGFTNAGGIQLTNTALNQAATLTVPNGSLTNTGTIDALVGASGGARTLTLALDNQGTINIGTATTLNKSGAAAHSNSGTINVTGGILTVTLSGADTFANAGTLNVAAGQQAVLTGGTLTNLSGTTLTGGTFVIAGTFKIPGNAGTIITTNAATLVLDGPASQIINAASVNTLANLATNTAAGSFTITNGRNFTQPTFANAGQVRVGTSSVLTTAGNFTQTGGTTTLDAGTLVAALVDVQAGTLAGNGTVTGPISSAGSVSPGLSAGQLNGGSTYAQTAAGNLAIEIGGTTAGVSFDRLNLTGAATLAGNLSVTTLAGYDPPAGTTYDILLASAVTGTFGSLNLVPLLGGKCWIVDYPAGSVRLTVHSPPTFNQQPTGGEICLNATVTLSASATGVPAPTYQWRNGGSDLLGETGTSLTITGFDATKAGSYDVVVTNSCGSQPSTPAVLTLDHTPPSITQCPQNQVISANSTCQAAIPNLVPGVVATDTCDLHPSITQSPPAGTVVGLGNTTVTLTVTDNVGNSSTCTVNVSVLDTTPPVITLVGPGEMTLQCHLSVYTELGATVTDNCGGTLVATIGGATVDTNVHATYVVTYDAVDTAGNPAVQVTRVVHVVDTIPPIINNLPNDLTVECQGPAGVPATDPVITAFLNLPKATDACDPTVPITNNAPAAFPLGNTLVTWTARDDSGNSVTASRTVTVADTVAPTIACPSTPDPIAVNAGCTAILPNLAALATASDLCSISVPVNQIPAAGTIIGLGNTFVTLTATDTAGNQSICHVTVTVVDTTPPTITCPANPSPLNANANCQAPLPNLTAGVVASDNCSVQVTQSPPAGTLVGVGNTIVTFTATDGAGLTATCHVTVTVVDITPPTITCPAPPAALIANANCKAALPDLAAGATVHDNCSVVTTQSPLAGTLVGLGITTVTLTATDGAGLTASCQVPVTVVDATPPTITCPPTPAPLQADAHCQATLPNLVPSVQAADNCSIVTVAQSPAAGTVIGLGNTIVTLTATDAVGLTATCEVVVTVHDNDADGDGVVDCEDLCPGTVPGSPVDVAGCPPIIPGDFDRDGDVDGTDFAAFKACFTGPAVRYQPTGLPPGCTFVPDATGHILPDFDKNGTVDQADFARFQRCFSGANRPANPSCGQ